MSSFMIGEISKDAKSNCCNQDNLSFCDICVFVMYLSDKEITVLRLNPNANKDKCVFSETPNSNHVFRSVEQPKITRNIQA